MPVNYEKETNIDVIFDNMIDYEGKIEYDVPYAVYVEFPTAYTDGAQPPFDPIHEWVQRNWPDLSSGLKEAVARDGQSKDEHMEAVAWMVVKGIEDSGTEGVFFAQRALERGAAEAGNVIHQYEGSDDPEVTRYIAEDMANFMLEESKKIIEREATDTEALLNSASVEVYSIENERRSGSDGSGGGSGGELDGGSGGGGGDDVGGGGGLT